MTTSFGGKRIVLLGIARTNIALARFLVAQGAEVTAYDDKPADELRARLEQLAGLPIRYALGGADLTVVDAADQLFVTPGASRDHPLVRRAAERGLPIASEIELLFELCPVPVAAITGSAGKTTTATLTGEMLGRAGLPTFVGGNIGTPLIDRLDQLTPDARVVLELSSFQLEHLRRSPHVGAILNVTPNHLDRHPTFEHYRDAKANLIAHQRPDDVAVLGLDDPVAASLVTRGAGRKMLFSLEQSVVEGACRHRDELVLAVGDLEGTICRQREVRLRGEHNLLNVLAAAVVAAVQGASLGAIRDVATTFEGIEHRLEPVRRLDGAAWFNDSKATSPDETIAALRSFAEPIVLLAGGRSKNAPLDEMAREIAARARALIVFGEMADEIAQAVQATPGAERLEVHRAPSLASAVALARDAARHGDVVLLSPSGASFDAFEDYEHRGRVFKQLVAALPARRVLS
ncbi:MAG TPA: UDP-N-acetylmuramoyl-L-alanine--D-glutamate ligase [Chloroflexota bacterium]|nr:UDP-N-acetylmuramoyl-L-alanine--D-glutamate ligase [Chloroflexota bacterium]